MFRDLKPKIITVMEFSSKVVQAYGCVWKGAGQGFHG